MKHKRHETSDTHHTETAGNDTLADTQTHRHALADTHRDTVVRHAAHGHECFL